MSPNLVVDHVIFAVRDLDSTSAWFTSHGFLVEPGGHHDGFGTRNALIHLDVGYLELLAVDDKARAAKAGLLGEGLIDLTHRYDVALAGFAIAVPAIAAAHATLSDEPGTTGPLELNRTTPDGRQLRWKLLIPGGTPWRRPWPMLIEPLDVSADERLGRHPNGATRLSGLTLEVDDLEATLRWYRRIGATATPNGSLIFGDVPVQLRAPAEPGPLGFGLSSITVAVDNLRATRPLLGELRSDDTDTAVILTAQAGADTILFEARPR